MSSLQKLYLERCQGRRITQGGGSTDAVLSLRLGAASAKVATEHDGMPSSNMLCPL